jgi:hypothetical protein
MDLTTFPIINENIGFEIYISNIKKSCKFVLFNEFDRLQQKKTVNSTMLVYESVDFRLIHTWLDPNRNEPM